MMLEGKIKQLQEQPNARSKEKYTRTKWSENTAKRKQQTSMTIKLEDMDQKILEKKVSGEGQTIQAKQDLPK